MLKIQNICNAVRVKHKNAVRVKETFDIFYITVRNVKTCTFLIACENKNIELYFRMISSSL